MTDWRQQLLFQRWRAQQRNANAERYEPPDPELTRLNAEEARRAEDPRCDECGVTTQAETAWLGLAQDGTSTVQLLCATCGISRRLQ